MRISNIKHEDGFTLIDLAIALVFVGILAAPLIAEYREYLSRTQSSQMKEKFADANEAIRQYYFLHNEYPCPADPTLKESNADYGKGDDCTRAGLIRATVPDVDGDGTADFVLIGALPFKDLNLSSDEALDPWKNQIKYAVSDLLTDETKYNEDYGMLTLRQEIGINPDGQCDPDEPAIEKHKIHYTIFSNGKSGAGAHNLNGVGTACPGPDLTRDQENCDADEVFSIPTCTASDTTDTKFYDDLFMSNSMANSMTKAPTQTWTPIDGTGNSGTTIGFVGLGNNDPQQALDVTGNIRIEGDSENDDKDGKAQATSFCDTEGQDCFQSSVIAGTDPRMKCGFLIGMTGISNNSADCELKIPGMREFKCPEGQFATQITERGDVICASP